MHGWAKIKYFSDNSRMQIDLVVAAYQHSAPNISTYCHLMGCRHSLQTALLLDDIRIGMGVQQCNMTHGSGMLSSIIRLCKSSRSMNARWTEERNYPDKCMRDCNENYSSSAFLTLNFPAVASLHGAEKVYVWFKIESLSVTDSSSSIQKKKHILTQYETWKWDGT